MINKETLQEFIDKLIAHTADHSNSDYLLGCRFTIMQLQRFALGKDPFQVECGGITLSLCTIENEK
jgi:hypothetical protein